jgi:NADH-quinone oxidoreductase subunit N
VNLHELVSQLIIDTKGAADVLMTPDSSLRAYLPELVLCVTVLVMLALRLPRWGRLIDTFWLALVGTAAALYLAVPWEHLRGAASPGGPLAIERMEIFTGMLVYDNFSVYVRSILLAFAVLFVIFTKLSGIPDREDSADIYSLVLGATLGMCMMASANHLLTVFLGVEMASVPSYVLAGLVKGRRNASEAALKYSVYGAGAAGVMLYGISLIAGLLNTAHLPTIAALLAEKFADPSLVPASEKTVLALGGLLISVGLAFKLSAVPFHFWCPDVFEGATAEVNAFLSIASKAAALALLVRVALGVSALPPEGYAPGQRTAAVGQEPAVGSEDVGDRRQETEAHNSKPYFVASADVEPAVTDVGDENPRSAIRNSQSAALQPITSFAAKLIAFFAIITCTFGNLAAYGQNNLKRLLAYSTIAHAGYMMMPVAAAVAMAGINKAQSRQKPRDGH